ncbi:MAG: tetratricopeptide repeat protein [Limisphaerales bacterium]
MASAGKGRMWSALGGFLGVLLALGLLAAYDVSQYLGNRTVDFLFNDDLKGVHDPDYEQAEQMYANGKPLEAIQMLREYLRKNPRQQHAALRIAEIYEKDLANYLAAALEYEEILKHKLPRERWGWAAIHLCNLYSKLGKNDQTVALLRRVAEEYSETAAAKKARKRLAMYESAGDMEALGTDMPEDPNMPEVLPTKVAAKKTDEEPPSNLPPGFRPKK